MIICSCLKISTSDPEYRKVLAGSRCGACVATDTKNKSSLKFQSINTEEDKPSN